MAATEHSLDVFRRRRWDRRLMSFFLFLLEWCGEVSVMAVVEDSKISTKLINTYHDCK